MRPSKLRIVAPAPNGYPSSERLRQTVRAAAPPAGGLRAGLSSRRVRQGGRRRLARKGGTAVNMDPNTHAYVLGTAFFTSLFFALAAWLPVGLLLRSILFG